MNTNKNSYTLIYMVVIIVIVSLLLSITSGVLRSRQDENVKLDKKKQILSSLLDEEKVKDNAADTYASTIKEYVMLNKDGEAVKTLDPVKDFDYEIKDGEYPIYVAEIEGKRKFVIPLEGAGLWGRIWGYIALNDDLNTIHGIYFNHASETPGLGAEIVTSHFRSPFVGKHILNAKGELASIAVMKAGQKAKDKEQVDAISGGTITSKGVESMLFNCLNNYAKLITANAEIDSADKPAEGNGDNDEESKKEKEEEDDDEQNEGCSHEECDDSEKEEMHSCCKKDGGNEMNHCEKSNQDMIEEVIDSTSVEELEDMAEKCNNKGTEANSNKCEKRCSSEKADQVTAEGQAEMPSMVEPEIEGEK